MAGIVGRLLTILHTSPYWVRFSLLAFAAVGINMLGLAATQWLNWSLLFFDMIGTAFASLLGGAVAGLVVALASAFFGSISTHDPNYIVYGYVNVVGAIVWSVLPRTGRPILGCYVFNLGDGATYRRAFFNILILGTVAGIATSIAAWAITAIVLPSDGSIATYGAGTATGANNRVLTDGLIKLTHADAGIGKLLATLLASAITNLPDKIISTASAVLLIVSYRTLPNYKEQKRIIRVGAKPIGARIIENRTLLFFTCIAQAVIFTAATYNITKNPAQAGWMFTLSCIIMVLVLIDPIYFRSVDRALGPESVLSDVFYPVPDDFHIGHHKAVFEDILKLMAVAVSGASFLIAMGSHGGCIPEKIETFKHCGPLYELAAVNALIVTGFRYICVIVMRVGNRR